MSLSDFDLLVIATALAGLAIIAFVLLWKLLRWPLKYVGVAFRPAVVERIVVGQIGLVVRQNLPLPMGLALAAESERGYTRTCLRDVSRLLGQGASLSEAMKKGCPGCSPLTISLIAAGEKSGQLSAALDQAAAVLGDSRRQPLIPPILGPLYLGLLITVAGTVTSLVMVVIVPKFMEILADYHASWPPISMSLVSTAEWFAQGAPPGWIYLFVSLLLVLFAAVQSRRRRWPRWVSRLVDRIRWHVPGLGYATFARGMATMLQTMRLGLRSGMNVGAAARLAAELRVNRRLSDRMARFADLLEQGVDLGEAAREARLGEVTAVALTSAQRSGRLDTGLRYAADYYAAVVGRLWITIRNLIFPVCTLVGAILVGWIILALFAPLLALLDVSMKGL